MNELTPMNQGDCVGLHGAIVALLEAARRSAARSVNSLMTATYWEIGRRVVEFEQGGRDRAAYGEALIDRLAADLSARFGRGFSPRNLWQIRAFHLAWRLADEILRTASAESGAVGMVLTASAQSAALSRLAQAFPLPWSAYVRLLSVKNPQARSFYETEALRGGWSVRQLDRQIGSQFYERTALSRNKAAMLDGGGDANPDDLVTPEQAIKDPFVLEFLDLKDEYSESDLEDALIQRLSDFLLELGDDFAFVGRQRRLRLDAGRATSENASGAGGRGSSRWDFSVGPHVPRRRFCRRGYATEGPGELVSRRFDRLSNNRRTCRSGDQDLARHVRRFLAQNLPNGTGSRRTAVEQCPDIEYLLI
jgi:predicted nuclease of restriction endonuclease-like (RecB) superfamily